MLDLNSIIVGLFTKLTGLTDKNGKKIFLQFYYSLITYNTIHGNVPNLICDELQFYSVKKPPDRSSMIIYIMNICKCFYLFPKFTSIYSSLIIYNTYYGGPNSGGNIGEL